MTKRQWQTRSVPSEFRADQDGDKRYIEGYFAVFDDVYELFPGATESIDKDAFNNTLDDDVRVLIDHDTRLVLGRTKAGTAELKVDEHGLFARVEVNESDVDATNLMARVERGDVDQASFGFDILAEEHEVKTGGEVHWTLKEVKLYEVSVVTFPAYESTAVTARKDDYRTIKKRELDQTKIRLKEKLRNGSKTSRAKKHDTQQKARATESAKKGSRPSSTDRSARRKRRRA